MSLEISKFRDTFNGRRWCWRVCVDGKVVALVCGCGKGLYTVGRFDRVPRVVDDHVAGDGITVTIFEDRCVEMVENPRPIPGCNKIAFKRAAALSAAKKLRREPIAA